MKSSINNLKVALVHDYLQWHGGAEKVIEELHNIFPDAPVYTSVYNERSMPDEYKEWDIRTSFMQNLPWWARFLKYYSILYPMAFEQFDFSEYDVVVSSSAGFAKGVITGTETKHIAYTHTPPRFLWGYETETRSKLSGLYTKLILPIVDNYLRIWDQVAAERVDEFISNSEEVKKRIKKFYHRDSKVINPPVDTKGFKPSKSKGDYYIVVGRLEAYKNYDLLIGAFNKMRKNLKVVGGGADLDRLSELAGPTVEVLGRVEDKRLKKLVSNSRGFVYATLEDFGIVMAEAQSAGIPVIAYRGGGASEIVIDGETGILFDELNIQDIISAVEKSEEISFDKDKLSESAERFSKQTFRNKVLELLDE